jgi:hypothetical protein
MHGRQKSRDFKEHLMRVTNSFMDEPAVPEAWVRLANALMFGPMGTTPASHASQGYDSSSGNGAVLERRRKWLDRLAQWLDGVDNWFWRQQQRQREAHLAQAKDIFDLEERMRRLERSGGRNY